MTRLVLAALLLIAPVIRTDDLRADDLPLVEVHARVEPDHVTVGSRFRYVVELVTRGHPETSVTQPADRIGDFDIVDFGIEPTVQQDDRTILRRWYTLVGWKAGEHTLISPPVRWHLPGEDPKEVTPAETKVTIDSVLARTPDAKDIRDIKMPEEFPIDWRPYQILGGGLAALVLIVLVLYRGLNRPRRARPGPPPRPAHEVAIAELDRLRARRLIAEGAFKEYYSALSAIIRQYLEQRFAVRAPEMTTEEFLLATARDARLQTFHRRLLGEFLTESDLVKFARHMPTIADTERAWEAARRFVQETAARPETETTRAAG